LGVIKDITTLRDVPTDNFVGGGFARLVSLTDRHMPSVPCYGDHLYEAFLTKFFSFGKLFLSLRM
jgi:hypothetical protein